MCAHIATHLPVIAQPAKAGRYGGVLPKSRMRSVSCSSQRLWLRVLNHFMFGSFLNGEPSFRRRSHPDAEVLVRKYHAASARCPAGQSQRTRRRDRLKARCPACIATLTARGNNLSSTPDERITHGMAMFSLSFCEAASSSCCVPCQTVASPLCRGRHRCRPALWPRR